MRNLLKVENLKTQFKLGKETVRAVNGVSFSVAEGEVLGIVGESGCGKSVTSLSIMRLIQSPGEIIEGKVLFNDGGKEFNLLKLSEKELEQILGNKIAMIFQDPKTSLNPVLSVGFQIAETLRIHRKLSKKDSKIKASELLQKVGIDGQRFNDYAHQFSGGMRQRVMIAMAVACEPKLLIADEPTTALDVTIQAQILNLILKLQNELGMSVIIISHDLGVIAKLANKVAVMYAGEIVEIATVKDIFERPQHPYTQALIASIPHLGFSKDRLPTIEGVPPRLREKITGCSFYPRCDFREGICANKSPVLHEIFPRHSAACFVADEESQKKKMKFKENKNLINNVVSIIKLV